ncbi:methylated-DNA--[protein]-cysteine S-methyltransferase [Corynebacterium sp. CCUG 65737]|uniref:methylated-DNA--[protein]-cysteine S-methyltransferase n=1 Tax=Corynebacterium sp. CCUG 65737 TaxID=2823889 RepID=UPI002108F74A|nr:methylated-DNA--[protein]-cysteine S-methyltransferase [Corynebacterium sp. CCUG 65737]MCQ4628127.1 methylated-DNA--[protein]-cysteine S-methyltransferase [Corynebacterium sp. CCUG 65737]
MTQPIVAAQTVKTPLGELGLEASESGLTRVVFGPVLGESNAVTRQAAAEIEQYFAGERREFTVPLDRSGEGFRAQAQAALSDIEYGRTETYSELAARIGNPRAVRAVGSACATNPLPIIVPCHRVLRSDGTLGGYAGGIEMKQYLLELEREHAIGG